MAKRFDFNTQALSRFTKIVAFLPFPLGTIPKADTSTKGPHDSCRVAIFPFSRVGDNIFNGSCEFEVMNLKPSDYVDKSGGSCSPSLMSTAARIFGFILSFVFLLQLVFFSGPVKSRPEKYFLTFKRRSKPSIMLCWLSRHWRPPTWGFPWL